MNRTVIIFSCVTLCIAFSIYYTSSLLEKDPQLILNSFPAKELHGPEDWMYRQRAYPHGRIRKDIYLQAMRQWQLLNNARGGQYPDWEAVGPSAIGGRITSLAVSPVDDRIIYVGAASGGVFKTIDGGENWMPIFDRAVSLSIGDLAVAPADAQTIFVGTGEANAGGGSLAYDGAGLYKSNDGGVSWSAMGLEQTGSTGKIVIHPEQSDRIYVATMGSLFANDTNRGLYRSKDGGQSWEQILYISDSTGVIDLAMHPDQPDLLFAASWERIRRPNRRQYGGRTSGVYRSTNGGDDWEKLSLPNISNRKLGRIGLTISPVNSNRIYASVVEGDNDLLLGVYRSDDLGHSWVELPLKGINQVPFMWWFGKIYADPLDAGRVYLCGLTLHQYQEGDDQWTTIMAGTHVDQHALYIEPEKRDFLLLGNDGGLYRGTNDFTNSWTHFDNLPITQFYTSEIDYLQADRLFGGTQDNGSLRRDPGSGRWNRILGGDGFVNLVDPTDSRFVYAESQYGNLRRSTTGGVSFSNGTPLASLSENKNWNTPVVLDPLEPSTLFYGAQRVYRSRDRAQNWQAISPVLVDTPEGSNLIFGSLSALAVSPADTRIIYAGADDGTLFITQDDGLSWESINQGLPRRWITSISAHPVDRDIAYVTFSGYRWNDYLPHVFRTENRGGSWIDISVGLPEVPANDLVINPGQPRQLMLATDAGVFISENEGLDWEVLGQGLPKVVVNDLTYHPPTQALVAATYGRSMYRLNLEGSPLTAGEERRWPVRELKAFPNPFREQTRIQIELEKASTLQVAIFDLSGRLVRQIHRGKLPAGTHRFDFPAPSKETYLCRVSTSDGRNQSLLLYPQ